MQHTTFIAISADAMEYETDDRRSKKPKKKKKMKKTNSGIYNMGLLSMCDICEFFFGKYCPFPSHRTEHFENVCK